MRTSPVSGEGGDSPRPRPLPREEGERSSPRGGRGEGLVSPVGFSPPVMNRCTLACPVSAHKGLLDGAGRIRYKQNRGRPRQRGRGIAAEGAAVSVGGVAGGEVAGGAAGGGTSWSAAIRLGAPTAVSRSACAWVACHSASSSAFSSWISRWRAWSNCARVAWPWSKRRSRRVHLRLETLGQAGGPANQPVGGVPLGGGRPDLGEHPLLGRLERPDGAGGVGPALDDQGLAVIQDRERHDEDQADVLDTDLVALVFRADDGGWSAVALGQADGGLGAGDRRPGGEKVGPALQRQLDQRLVLHLGEVPRQDELTERLGGPGRLGHPDLVAQIGQRVGIVLLGDLDLLAGRLVLHLRQRDVGGVDLTGLEPAPSACTSRSLKAARSRATRSFSRR